MYHIRPHPLTRPCYITANQLWTQSVTSVVNLSWRFLCWGTGLSPWTPPQTLPGVVPPSGPAVRSSWWDLWETSAASSRHPDSVWPVETAEVAPVATPEHAISQNGTYNDLTLNRSAASFSMYCFSLSAVFKPSWKKLQTGSSVSFKN